MTRVRIWRKLKWPTTAACLIVSVVWGWSGFQCLKIAQQRDSGAMLTHGTFSWLRADVAKRRTMGISTTTQDSDVPFVMLSKLHPVPEYCWPRPAYHSIGAYQHELIIPLWLPMLVLLIPALWMWWMDRVSIEPGHCERCGYDLTGNVSGRCPECGDVVRVS